MSKAIEVRGLHKNYRKVVAVDDVTMSVYEGEIHGIVGRNGAGKSTTVECVAGLRKPTRGTIKVLGLDPLTDRAALRQVLGVQLQDSQVHGALTVRELARLYRSFYRTGADPDDLIDRLGLSESRQTKFDDLSGGQQQRLSVVLALIGQPRVALLDELTTGLDVEARRDIWALIEDLARDGVTVVLVSHSMEEVQRLCDHVTVIDRGRVVAAGTIPSIIEAANFPPGGSTPLSLEEAYLTLTNRSTPNTDRTRS